MPSSKLETAKLRLDEATAERQRIADEIEKADETADVDSLEQRWNDSDQAVEAAKREVALYERIESARGDMPAPAAPEIKVVKEESTYRKDGKVSFFRDLAFRNRDEDAAERMRRHEAEMADRRDVSSSGNGFIPPIYLSELAAEFPRAGRPLVDALPKAPLPASGTSFTVPKVTGGSAVAAQTDGGNVQETDPTTSQPATYVRTIAGQVDISQQLLDRSDPAFDVIVLRDLQNAYDTELDRQVINGVAASNEHVGLLNVSGVNSITFTSATPTAADFLPPIYKAIEQISSNRFLPATHVVMAPRRAAFLAAGLSASAPVFQQGQLTLASGTQNGALVNTIAGLPVIVDANVPVNASTDQDRIIAIHAPDLAVMEGDVRTRVLDAPLSDTLEVRIQLFGYSAFLSERYAKGISVISGTGLNEVL
jgi:HK97 family phage major capsid protein